MTFMGSLREGTRDLPRPASEFQQAYGRLQEHAQPLLDLLPGAATVHHRAQLMSTLLSTDPVNDGRPLIISRRALAAPRRNS